MRLLALIGIGTALALATPARAEPPRDGDRAARQGSQHRAGHQGRAANAERGRASYYGPEFNGRRTASGTRFNPNEHVAASKTLPLGTTARVTNLENGRSTEVKVEDRGPYVRGRVMDVSPRAADDLDMKRQGTAPVEVQPLSGGEAGARPSEGQPRR